MSSIGKSAAWREVLRRAALVAPTDATVLVQGETGTGKQLIAGRIHASSKRPNPPCITLNYAAIPATLLATRLGIPRSTLDSRMRSLGINKYEFLPAY